jgi:hypothetical protein
MLHHVALKWCRDILKCGPVIFQHVPDVMSHYYDQKYIYLLYSYLEVVRVCDQYQMCLNTGCSIYCFLLPTDGSLPGTGETQ